MPKGFTYLVNNSDPEATYHCGNVARVGDVVHCRLGNVAKIGGGGIATGSEHVVAALVLREHACKQIGRFKLVMLRLEGQDEDEMFAPFRFTLVRRVAK